MNTQIVPSSELKTGDIVLVHEMRVLLLKLNCQPYQGHNANLVYSWDGEVLNRDDVPSGLVPISFTRNWTDDGPDHRWTVQGNDLVEWMVESST